MVHLILLAAQAWSPIAVAYSKLDSDRIALTVFTGSAHSSVEFEGAAFVKWTADRKQLITIGKRGRWQLIPFDLGHMRFGKPKPIAMGSNWFGANNWIDISKDLSIVVHCASDGLRCKRLDVGRDVLIVKMRPNGSLFFSAGDL